MNPLHFKKPSLYRLAASLIGVVYVWSLPLLADIGFAESGSTSISKFIANPPATGAMSSVSFIPMTLMWEYQDYILSRDIYFNNKKLWITTLCLFQFFYGLFLTCTDGIAPDWLHTSTVVLFGTSFICHSIIILLYIESRIISKVILGIGILSFLCLLFAEEMWFWTFECIGFSSMLIFTPMEWFLLSDNSGRSEYGIF